MRVVNADHCFRYIESEIEQWLDLTVLVLEMLFGLSL
jgi:hypothetical protein